MLSDVLSIYSKDDKFLILNPLVPAWIVTNITGVMVVNTYVETMSVKETVKVCHRQNIALSEDMVRRFLDAARSASLFAEKTIEHTHKPYFLHALYLNMTEKCNLCCTYCYASSRKELGKETLSFDDYKRILLEAKSISGKIDVIFTGGEPLLSKITLDVARFAKTLGFDCRVLTNGTLIDENNVNEIVSCFDSFKISLDGSSKEKHDFYRGNGSYERTIRALELLDERNVDFQLAMVVTKENVDDVSAMNKKWGSRLTYQPLFPLGKAKEQKQISALTGLEYYDAMCQNANINPFSDISNIIKAHKKNRSIVKCAMGDGELSISCTGDVYPCQLLHAEGFCLGNVHSQSLQSIYNSMENEYFKFHTVDKIEKCKDCDFRYLCGGACQARHFSETGTIDKSGDFCKYEQCGIVYGIISNCKMVEI